jgi:hypothetical protein
MRFLAAIALIAFPIVAEADSVLLKDTSFGELIRVLSDDAAIEREILGVDLSKLSSAQMTKLARLGPKHNVTFAWPMRGKTSFSVLRDLHDTGLLRKVSRLLVDCGERCVKLIASSHYAAGLRELSVYGKAHDYLPHLEPSYFVNGKTASLLAQSRRLPRLRVLRIAANGEVVRILLSGRLKLSTLDLTTDDAGVRELARARSARSLRVLRLVGLGFSAGSISDIVKSPHLRRGLRILDFQGSDSEAETVLGDVHVDVIARDMRLQGLRYLDLSWNYAAGREAVANLIAASWIDQLEGLCFHYTGWRESPKTVDAVVARGPWPRLKLLCEDKCPQGYENVCDSQKWEQTVRSPRH